MATDAIFLENFPVKFQLEEDSCLECDTRQFCQLAEWGDRFEFAYIPATADVPVTNGTFTGSLTGWTAGAGWTYSAGKALLTNNTGSLAQTIIHTIGRKYKITFTVSDFSTSGSGYLDVTFGGASWGANNAHIQANGTYTVYLVPFSSGDLGFAASAANVIAKLDNVTMEVYDDDCGILLKNTDTGTYSGIVKYSNLNNESSPYRGYSYLWSDMGVLYDGCYKIALYGSVTGSNIIVNGTFTGSAASWTITGFSSPNGWFYNSNSVKFYGTQAATITSYIDQNITAGLTAIATPYKITFTVSSYASGSFIPMYVVLVIGGFEFDLMTVTANGTYTITTPAIDNSVAMLLRFGKNASMAVPVNPPDTSWTLDNVTMLSLSCAEIELSECYKVSTDHGCTTKMLKWTNEAVNGFNYPYYYFYSANNQYGFQHMRVECDLRNSRYPGEAEKYIDSGGNEIQYLGSVRKNKVLYIAAMPEYMHDALAIGLKHKAFYIDDVRYVFQDTDYEPEWGNDRLVIAESQILIGKYTQDNYSID